MIQIDEILNDEGKFNKGIHVSPNWVAKGEKQSNWVLYDTEGAIKHLNRLKRKKGRKDWSILINFTDSLMDWVSVPFTVLMDMVRHRDTRYRNCTVNQLWYIKSEDTRHRAGATIWPAEVRNDNENRDNNWGQ